MRFAQEVLDSIRTAVGPGFPIEFRMSGSELFDGGYDLQEGIRIAKLLESRIDLLHVSAGTYQPVLALPIRRCSCRTAATSIWLPPSSRTSRCRKLFARWTGCNCIGGIIAMSWMMELVKTYDTHADLVAKQT